MDNNTPFVIEVAAPGKCFGGCIECLNATETSTKKLHQVSEKTWACVERLIHLPEFRGRNCTFMTSSPNDFQLSSLLPLAHLPIQYAHMGIRIEEVEKLGPELGRLTRSLFPHADRVQFSLEQSREKIPAQIQALIDLVPFVVNMLIEIPQLKVGTVGIGINDANTKTQYNLCQRLYSNFMRQCHEAATTMSDKTQIGELVELIRKKGFEKYEFGGNGTPHGFIHRFEHETTYKSLHLGLSLRTRKNKLRKGSTKRVILKQLREFQESGKPSTYAGYFSGNLVNIHHSPDTFLSTGENPSWADLDQFELLLKRAEQVGYTEAKIDFLSGSRK